MRGCTVGGLAILPTEPLCRSVRIENLDHFTDVIIDVPNYMTIIIAHKRETRVGPFGFISRTDFGRDVSHRGLRQRPPRLTRNAISHAPAAPGPQRGVGA